MIAVIDRIGEVHNNRVVIGRAEDSTDLRRRGAAVVNQAP